MTASPLPPPRNWPRAALVLTALAILGGCGRGSRPRGDQTTSAAAAGSADSSANSSASASDDTSTTPDVGSPAAQHPGRTPAPPAGAAVTNAALLVDHPGNIQPGLTAQRRSATLSNPREHDPRALEEGKQLFVAYNCADCHGSEGSGAVGPSLQDGRWHFGGTAGEIYESISEGRPDGMPAWGGRISETQIWALVAYVRRLSAGQNVSTENFEGATVERSGH
jgi:mono/diheme cytochrome c family protein